MKKTDPVSKPKLSDYTTEDWQNEKKRLSYSRKYRRTLKSSISLLVVAASLAVLAATLWLPILRVYGNSMTPALNAGDLVLSTKTSHFNTGDVVAFYYNNRVLVKRVIAGPGDWVDIDLDGTVKVNNKVIDEPYISEKSIGETDLDYPYQVPEDRWFVMGDHRDVSMDSRKKAIGSIAEEQILGKLIFLLWPFEHIGPIQ